MRELLTKIRKKIDEKSSVSVFADEQDIRKASLYDFLNGKTGISIPTFHRVITSLGMDVLENLPDEFTTVDCVYIDGKTYHKGDMYKGKKILLTFGTGSTSHQGVLFENNRLKIF